MPYLNQNSSKSPHCLFDYKQERRGGQERGGEEENLKAFSSFLQSSLWAVNALNVEHEWAGRALSFLSGFNSKITELLSNVIPGHLLKSQHFPQIFRALFCAYFFLLSSYQYLTYDTLYILSIFLSFSVRI